MAEQIIFKTWSDNNVFTNRFKMTSKYTDLGSPDGKSSIIGVICNIIVEDESTVTSPSSFNLLINYRTSLNTSFKLLTSFNNVTASNHSNKGAIEFIKYLSSPLKNISHIQFQIQGYGIRNNFGINDIGLIFRNYRSSNIANFNED
jgi:hypothetical protein